MLILKLMVAMYLALRLILHVIFALRGEPPQRLKAWLEGRIEPSYRRKMMIEAFLCLITIAVLYFGGFWS